MSSRSVLNVPALQPDALRALGYAELDDDGLNLLSRRATHALVMRVGRRLASRMPSATAAEAGIAGATDEHFAEMALKEFAPDYAAEAAAETEQLTELLRRVAEET